MSIPIASRGIDRTVGEFDPRRSVERVDKIRSERCFRIGTNDDAREGTLKELQQVSEDEDIEQPDELAEGAGETRASREPGSTQIDLAPYGSGLATAGNSSSATSVTSSIKGRGLGDQRG